MHGTYRISTTQGGVRHFALSSDLDALIDSFPGLTFVDRSPRTLREKWSAACLGVSASAILLTIGGSTEYRVFPPEAVPPVEPAPEKAERPATQNSAERITQATPRAADPVQAPPLVLREDQMLAPTPADAPAASPIAAPAAPAEADAVSAPLATMEPDLGAPDLGAPEIGAIEDPLAVEEELLSEADALLAPPVAASANQGGLTHLTVRVDGAATGEIAFSDQGQVVSVQLGSLLALFSDRFPPAEYERLANSPAADDFVAIDKLADAGLSIDYDAVYDEIVIDTGSSVAAGEVQPQSPSEYS